MGRAPHLGGLCFVVLLLVVPVPSRAGAPYVTGDPEPVAYQSWELYLVSQVAHLRGLWAGTGPHFEADYGLLPDLELHFVAPFVFIRPDEGTGRYGYGDTEIGFTLRFMHETEWSPQVGTAPLLELLSGGSRSGLVSGHVQAFLPLWLQKSFGPWTTYGGGGYWINPGTGNKDYWFVGWQVQRRILEWATMGVEVFHTTAARQDGEAQTRFNVGLVIDFTQNHHLLLSAGRGIQGPTDFQGYLAYEFTFDRRK